MGKCILNACKFRLRFQFFDFRFYICICYVCIGLLWFSFFCFGFWFSFWFCLEVAYICTYVYTYMQVYICIDLYIFIWILWVFFHLCICLWIALWFNKGFVFFLLCFSLLPGVCSCALSYQWFDWLFLLFYTFVLRIHVYPKKRSQYLILWLRLM